MAKEIVTPEKAIKDLREIMDNLCDEVEKDLKRALLDPVDRDEAVRLEPVIRSWISHLRAWDPPTSPPGPRSDPNPFA